MTQTNQPNHLDEDDGYISKSHLKREMAALQELGDRLTRLKPDQLTQIHLSDRLRAALDEAQRITRNEAKRRHSQYLGKLMRQEDTQAIRDALDRMDAGGVENTRLFHLAEQWRDRLLKDATAVTPFVDAFPAADVQHLRNLVRNAQQDLLLEKNRGHSKKLFRYLREIVVGL